MTHVRMINIEQFPTLAPVRKTRSVDRSAVLRSGTKREAWRASPVLFLIYFGDLMLLPKGTTAAVADGGKFNLFSNTGDEANPSADGDARTEYRKRKHGVRREPRAVRPILMTARPRKTASPAELPVCSTSGCWMARFPISSLSPPGAPSASFAKLPQKVVGSSSRRNF